MIEISPAYQILSWTVWNATHCLNQTLSSKEGTFILELSVVAIC